MENREEERVYLTSTSPATVDEAKPSIATTLTQPTRTGPIYYFTLRRKKKKKTRGWVSSSSSSSPPRGGRQRDAVEVFARRRCEQSPDAKDRQNPALSSPHPPEVVALRFPPETLTCDGRHIQAVVDGFSSITDVASHN
jgi:hypothetical protein